MAVPSTTTKIGNFKESKPFLCIQCYTNQLMGAVNFLVLFCIFLCTLPSSFPDGLSSIFYKSKPFVLQKSITESCSKYISAFLL